MLKDKSQYETFCCSRGEAAFSFFLTFMTSNPIMYAGHSINSRLKDGHKLLMLLEPFLGGSLSFVERWRLIPLSSVLYLMFIMQESFQHERKRGSDLALFPLISHLFISFIFNFAYMALRRDNVSVKFCSSQTRPVRLSSSLPVVWIIILDYEFLRSICWQQHIFKYLRKTAQCQLVPGATRGRFALSWFPSPFSLI